MSVSLHLKSLPTFLETTVDKISDTLSNSGRHVSMDAPFVQGEENTLLDVLENHEPNTDSSLINESLSEEIKRSLSTLTEREREIIVLFFGLSSNHPLSLEEIGEKFNLTRERVRQIKDKALQRLRHTSRSKILKSYLG
jgi:RNA polymerase primary sigma factor